MKPIPECVPDALDAIIATAKAVSDEDFIHRKVLLKVMGELAEDGDLGSHPADIYLQCWEIACRALGVKDPFENEKARGDKAALGILKYLQEHDFAGCARDPLRRGIKLSLAGAMLGYSGLGRGDMQAETLALLATPPALDGTDALVEAVEKAASVMIVADRAGEVALDKPLAEAVAGMGKAVYLGVAAKPVFLMATEKDAENARYPETVRVVNPGTAMCGLVLERSSSEFRDLLCGAGLVIVKGSTHWATMTPDREHFFILKADDADVASELGVPAGGGAIFKRMKIDA